MAMEAKVKYGCIFEPDQPCLVRAQWKLMPENLIEWCKLCESRKRLNPLQLANKLVDLIDIMQDRQYSRDKLIAQTFASAIVELKKIMPTSAKQ